MTGLGGRGRTWSVAVAAALFTCAAGALAARRISRPAPIAPAPIALPAGAELRVPHAAGAISLDGDMDDPGWLRARPARTNAFQLTDGTRARPYSDARFVWGDGCLYVLLYAADQDIRATQTQPDAPLWLEDSFHLVFSDADGDRTIDVSPSGVVTDAQQLRGKAIDYGWSSGVHVSRELDGTPNDPRDDDEEWVLELAIPLDALGLSGERGERIGFSVSRCDTPKHARQVCAAWNGGEPGELVLD